MTTIPGSYMLRDAGRKEHTVPRVLPLFTKALTDSWRSTVAWALGLSAACMLYLRCIPRSGAVRKCRT